MKTKLIGIYKIKVFEYGGDYKVNLYKKGWLFWNLLESRSVVFRTYDMFHTQVEISNIIRKWQAQFSVPDEMVFIQD